VNQKSNAQMETAPDGLIEGNTATDVGQVQNGIRCMKEQKGNMEIATSGFRSDSQEQNFSSGFFPTLPRNQWLIRPLIGSYQSLVMFPEIYDGWSSERTALAETETSQMM
jgi:hypothetical protein